MFLTVFKKNEILTHKNKVSFSHSLKRNCLRSETNQQSKIAIHITKQIKQMKLSVKLRFKMTNLNQEHETSNHFKQNKLLLNLLLKQQMNEMNSKKT